MTTATAAEEPAAKRVVDDAIVATMFDPSVLVTVRKLANLPAEVSDEFIHVRIVQMIRAQHIHFPRRQGRGAMLRVAMVVAASAAAIVLSGGVAHAEPRVIEQCHWNDVSAWVYQDGSLCRSTGENPTTDSYGKPACADFRTAVPVGDGRVTCLPALSQ